MISGDVGRGAPVRGSSSGQTGLVAAGLVPLAFLADEDVPCATARGAVPWSAPTAQVTTQVTTAERRARILRLGTDKLSAKGRGGGPRGRQGVATQ